MHSPILAQRIQNFQQVSYILCYYTLLYYLKNKIINTLVPCQTDIIGALENYESLHDIDTVNGVRSVVRFKMTDGR